MMNSSNDIDDPRRRLLVQALSLGLFSSAALIGDARAWSLFGDKPKKMPAGKSIYRLTGSATINGSNATQQSIIKPGDTLETGPDSELIFVVGGNSMILRSKTRMVIDGGVKDADSSPFISALRLLAGKVLSVSRNSPMNVLTPTATIGVRGTGWYAEADPELTYFCTCYGKTDISANNDPASKKTVVSEHHDEPVYIAGNASSGQSISKAPFVDHTDQELALIEALVGRSPPYVFHEDDYSGPRRGY